MPLIKKIPTKRDDDCLVEMIERPAEFRRRAYTAAWAEQEREVAPAPSAKSMVPQPLSSGRTGSGRA